MEIPYAEKPRDDTGLYNGKAGIWLFLASEVMLFGALFSAYVLLRVGADPGTWSMGLMNKWIGAFNTLILIASSVTVVLAWICLKMDDFKGFRMYKWWTIIFAAAFLVVKWSYEWPDKFTHYDVTFADQYKLTIKDAGDNPKELAEAISQARPSLGDAESIEDKLLNGNMEIPNAGKELGERLAEIGNEKKPVIEISDAPTKTARAATGDFFKDAYGKDEYRATVMIRFYKRFGKEAFASIFGAEFLDHFKKGENGWEPKNGKTIEELFDKAPLEKIALSGHITGKRDSAGTLATPNIILWIRECWLWRKGNMEEGGILSIDFHADGSDQSHDTDTAAAKKPEGSDASSNIKTHHGVHIETDQIRRIISYEPAHSTFFATYFTLTGLHALHVFGGILVMIYHLMPISVRVWNHSKDQFANRIEITGLFWHFVDLVWIFLFPILYLL